MNLKTVGNASLEIIKWPFQDVTNFVSLGVGVASKYLLDASMQRSVIMGLSIYGSWTITKKS